jgi:hypothetical protein
VDEYIDEFAELVNVTESSDPTSMVLKFRRGLILTIQDRIVRAEM